MKAVADYLGRSPRTVQRWLSEYGLPVRRLGGDTGPIFAYADELDGWLRNRGQTMRKEPSDLGRPVLLQMPSSQSEPVECVEVFDSHSSSGSREGRSSQLTARAYKMWETLSVTDFSAMARLFRDAIDLDPGNAKALAGLSLALIADKLMGNLNIQMAAASAKDALRRSLEIDPESLEATCSKAWLKIASERDWEGGGRGFAEVLRHVPLCGPALIGRALLHIAQGRLAEASDLLSEASIQYPLSAPTMLFQCWNDYLTGQYAKALDLIAQARAIGHCGSALDAVEALSLTGLEDPDESVERVKALIAGSPPGSSHHHLLQGVLGYSYAAAGRTHEAQTALHNFMHSKIPPNTSHGYSLALILLGLNDRENAVRWLQKSYCEGSLWSFGFRSDPILAPLRNEPYRQLLFDNLSYPASEGLPSRLASAS